MDKSRGTPLKKPLRIINEFKVRGKETPLQNEIREFVIKHPNCTVSDMYKDKSLGKHDHAGIRRAIRKMVEGHRVIQKFSIN